MSARLGIGKSFVSPVLAAVAIAGAGVGVAQGESACVGQSIILMSRLTVPPNIIGTMCNDTVSAAVNSNDIGIDVEQGGVIDTKGGFDTVSGTGIGDSTYGIHVVGLIKLGSEDDHISGRGSFAGINVNVGGVLDGENGNDVITGFANSTGFTHNASGIIVDGHLIGGNGDDSITGEARGVAPGSVSGGIVLEAGVLDAGNGNDTITGIGINENIGFGIEFTAGNGSVLLGSGNDIVTGYGTSGGIGNPVGVTHGIIDGGSGNDYFKARRVNSGVHAVDNQGGAIANVVVMGGDGDDTFDVGYGNAELNGGGGFDTLILLGSPGNYSISGSNQDLTIERDGYLLRALNIEKIVYVPNP